MKRFKIDGALDSPARLEVVRSIFEGWRVAISTRNLLALPSHPDLYTPIFFETLLRSTPRHTSLSGAIGGYLGIHFRGLLGDDGRTWMSEAIATKTKSTNGVLSIENLLLKLSSPGNITKVYHLVICPKHSICGGWITHADGMHACDCSTPDEEVTEAILGAVQLERPHRPNESYNDRLMQSGEARLKFSDTNTAKSQKMKPYQVLAALLPKATVDTRTDAAYAFAPACRDTPTGIDDGAKRDQQLEEKQHLYRAYIAERKAVMRNGDGWTNIRLLGRQQ